MSKRMVRRIDLVTAFARWAGLLLVPIIAVLVPSSRTEVGISGLLIAGGIMAMLDTAPVTMLYLGFYPDVTALTFLVLDSVFALLMLLLAGPSMFYYSLIPVIGFSVRFDWRAGLADALSLIAGGVAIALVRGGLQDTASVLVSVSGQSAGLIVASVLTGLLTRNIKSEPPLNAREVRAREEEMQRLRAAADRARAIYEMAGTLSATLNREKLLDAVLEISTVGFDELNQERKDLQERPAGAVFLNSEDGLYVAASRGLTHEEADLSLSAERGALLRVFGNGQPLVLGNLADDPELRRLAAFRRCRSAVCVPLRAGFEVCGAVVFASPTPHAFSEEYVELLCAVSNQAAVALTNAQLYQDLEKEKERIIEVEEEARTKLARDLHDGPTQSISAIAMRLNFVRLLLGRDPQKVKDELFKLENLARRTTKEIRTMLFTLRPVVLETQGLKAAVEQLAERFREIDDLPIFLEIEDMEGKLDANIQAVAWFITEESLNNAKKWADATRIDVRMYIRDEHFVTEITDNGKGFDVDAIMANYDQRSSFGLLNLQERAELVNGRTTIRSAPGQGTQITLVVPLSREVA